MTCFFSCHVHHAELFDTGSVHNKATKGKRKHTGEGGGMLSLLMIGTDIAHPHIQFGLKGIDQRRFAYSGMSGQKSCLILQ